MFNWASFILIYMIQKHLWEWYLLSFSVWFKVGSLSWSFKYKNTKYKNTKKTSESDLTLVQLSSYRLASLIIHKAKTKVVPSIKGVRFLFVLHSFLYSPSFFRILYFFLELFNFLCFSAVGSQTSTTLHRWCPEQCQLCDFHLRDDKFFKNRAAFP